VFVAITASNELANYMRRNNVNPLKNLIVPFAQVDTFDSVFVGLYRIFYSYSLNNAHSAIAAATHTSTPSLTAIAR